jgi:hypothetical protein
MDEDAHNGCPKWETTMHKRFQQVIGLLFFSGSAFSSPILMGVSTPGTPATSTTYLVEETPINGNFVTSANPTGSAASNLTFSNVQWTAGFGNLHASALSSMPGDTSLARATAARLGTTWTDFFQLTPTVPNPGPVTLMLSILLHGSVTATFDQNKQIADAFGGAGIDDAIAQANQINQETCTVLAQPCAAFIEDDSGLNASSAIASVSNCAQGCYVGLTGWLEVDSEGIDLGPPVASRFAKASADFSNTAGFHVDVLSPGWQATSVSGTNYASPTPEPASLALLGFGLVALGTLGRKLRDR